MMAQWLALVAACCACAATIVIRVWPRLGCPAFGIDSWYYLTYARALREGRRWPVTLPCYLLDDPEQVYPPLLPWLLSWWPTRWLERASWAISAGWDAMHCALLAVVVWVVTQSWVAVLGAGLLFATSPVLVAQATELNARPLGALLFSVFMLALWTFEVTPSWWSAALVLASGILILWTHKMTGQQMAAALFAWSLWHRDPRYVTFAAAMIGLSLLGSRGWFMNLLRGHREIIAFWRGRLHLLGAHQVYDSPLYANPEKARQKRGVTGVRASRLPRWMATSQLAAVVCWMIAAPSAGWIAATGWSGYLLRWTGLIFLTVGLTTWMPWFTQFGEGFKYLRYGVFAWSGLLGLWLVHGGPVAAAGVGALLAAQAVVTWHIVRGQRRNLLAPVDTDTRAVLQALAKQPEDGVLALPFSRCEPVAYFARKRVLWGAHGRGWDRLAPFWPVLQRPIETFLDEYRLHWIWIDSRYVDVTDLRLTSERLEPWLSCGPHQVFRYRTEGAALSGRNAGGGNA